MREAPQWVLRGATIDLDFRRNRYWGGFVARFDKAPGALLQQETNFTPNLMYMDGDGNLRFVPTDMLALIPGTGLWSQEPRTNYLIYNSDLTNAAWTKTGIAVTQDQSCPTVPAFANNATHVTASAANGTVLQAITQASQAWAGAAFIKRTSGVGSLFMTLDGGTTWTDVTAQLGTLPNGWGWISIPTQTLANPSFGFKIATSGDGFIICLGQVENGTSPTMPIATTNASVARFNEEPTYGSVDSQWNQGNFRIIKNILISGRPWSGYFEQAGTNNGTPIVSDFNLTIWGGVGGVAQIFQTSPFQNTANSGVASILSRQKVAVTVTPRGARICLNGGPIASLSTITPLPSSTAATHCGIGNNGAGTCGYNGYAARQAFWSRELTDAELRRLTS